MAGNFDDVILIIVEATEDSQTVLSQALEHMRRHTFSRLLRMKQDEKFAVVDWTIFNGYLPETLLENFEVEANSPVKRCSLPSRVSMHQQSRTNSNNPVTSLEMDTSVSLNNPDEKHRQKIRNQLVVRFLTAMSIDYEKQWHLGKIRRRTLDILIKSVEKAKDECSLQLHWQLLVKSFRLPFLLRHLIKFSYFDLMNKCTNRLLFDHIIQTIELTFSE